MTGYYDKEGHAHLVLINKKKKAYYMQIYDDMKFELLGDGHCSINLGYHNGLIWYAYGSHSTPLYYGTVELNSFRNTKQIYASKADIMATYPAFYTIGNNFYFLYRNDYDRGWDLQDLTNATEFDFSNQRMLINYSNLDNGARLYINDIGSSSDGSLIAIPYVIRLNSTDELVRNDGIYLAYSKDSMKTWETYGKDSVETTIIPNNDKKLIKIGQEENLINQESTYVTNNGWVFFTRLTDDKNGIPQLYLSGYKEGSEPVSYLLTDNTVDFQLLGVGTLTLPVSRGQVIASDKYLHVIFRQDDELVIASTEYDESGIKEPFDKLKMTDFELGDWEPNFDTELWKGERKLALYVQNAEQGESDQLKEELTGTNGYILYFSEYN